MNSILYGENAKDAVQRHQKKHPGCIVVRSKKYKIIGALYPIPNTPKWVYTIWVGDGAKPAADFSAMSREKAEAYLLGHWNRAEEKMAYKAAAVVERRAKKASVKASDFWTVGDVVHTTWGYEQTNVEWFQVVELKPKSVKVRQIAGCSSDFGGPSGGTCQPRRNEFIGPDIMCPINERGEFSAGPCYRGEKPSFRHNCYKWDGSAVYTSSNY